MAKDKRIIIEIPEAQLDFSNENWKETVKEDFQSIQNILESNPNPASPAYYTWFWFFMKYGRALCSKEGQAYLQANNINPFIFVKDAVGLTMSGGGAYTIGYKFFDECLKNSQGVDVSGIKIQIDRSQSADTSNAPLQQIYYGAPGTGKSHIINEITEGESVIRTTFHPDSDYSTFVGAYKPTTKEITMRDLSGHPIMEGGKVLTEDKIVYEFVEQAFLQAYVQAWKYYADADAETKPKKQYLVIEEINRGNCAQIFGDLFQLLDRSTSGFSDYPINADNDMKKQLAKAFKGLSVAQADGINACYKGKDVVSKVLSGEILLLPNNLYIWATMNTSDQSLFPIDSAFKRRWDWQYMPISKGMDNGTELNWKISADTKEYDWWSFLEKINAHVGTTTNSEDKKLGFFFCKAVDGIISAETFVGKVIFYLWNDVFKDFGFEGPIFKDADGSELSFNKFYKTDNTGRAIVQKDKVELFLNNLGVEEAGDIIAADDTDGDDKVGMSVLYNGETIREKNDLETYVKTLEKIGVERISPLNITCHGQMVVGVEPPGKYAWRTVNGFKVLTFKLHRHMERILNDIAAGLHIDIKVSFE